MEKSNSFNAAGPQYPQNTGNSEFNPNNPFRNQNALGAPAPPPYERQQGPGPYNNTGGSNAFAPNGGAPFVHNSGSPFAQSYNDSRQNSGGYQPDQKSSYGDEKSGGQFPPGGNFYNQQQVNSYQQPQQGQYFSPPPGPPSQSGSYYPADVKGSQGDYQGSRDMGPDGGFSNRDFQGSYNQGPQQGQGHWYDNNPAYQSSPGPNEASSSRGFFSPPPQQQVQPYQQPTRSNSSNSVLKKMGGKNPLDPPPPQFARPAPGNYPYAMFPPMVCLSISTKLGDGFHVMAPPAPYGLQQHPFMSHDITEPDWTKFLTDLKAVAQLSGKDRLISNGIPLALGMGIVGGLLASHAIEKNMKSRKVGPQGDLIDAWNNYFFHPRRMTVVLCQGDLRFNGPIDNLPPDMLASGYDSDSDSDHSYHGGRSRHDRGPSHDVKGGFLAVGNTSRRSRSASGSFIVDRISDRHARRADRWERRADRKANRIDRIGGLVGALTGTAHQQQQAVHVSRELTREPRRSHSGHSSDKWRLVICYWDGRREVY